VIVVVVLAAMYGQRLLEGDVRVSPVPVSEVQGTDGAPLGREVADQVYPAASVEHALDISRQHWLGDDHRRYAYLYSLQGRLSVDAAGPPRKRCGICGSGESVWRLQDVADVQRSGVDRRLPPPRGHSDRSSTVRHEEGEMLRWAVMGGVLGVVLTLLLTYGAAAVSGGSTEEMTDPLVYMGTPLIILGVVSGALAHASRERSRRRSVSVHGPARAVLMGPRRPGTSDWPGRL
jgi:hypothetical protein